MASSLVRALGSTLRGLGRAFEGLGTAVEGSGAYKETRECVSQAVIPGHGSAERHKPPKRPAGGGGSKRRVMPLPSASPRSCNCSMAKIMSEIRAACHAENWALSI